MADSGRRKINPNFFELSKSLAAESQSNERASSFETWDLLNAIPLKIFWKGRDLRFLGCNQLFCLDAGIESSDTIVGLSDFDMPWTRAEAEFYRSCDLTIMDRNEPEIGIIESQTSADGTLCWVETSKVPLHDAAGNVVGILGIYHDVTRIKESEQALQHRHDQLERSKDELETCVLQRTRELQYMAEHDELTHLANRGYFLAQLNVTLGEDDSRFALLFVDLDRFKSVNDSLGHGAGDELLVQVSQVLNDAVRPNDVVGRFGGDEFAVLIRGVRNREEVVAISERIQSKLRNTITIDDCPHVVTASIGVVIDMCQRYESADDLLRDADIAMYEAKGNGKARHQIFNDEMYRRNVDRSRLEHEMRVGLQKREFYVEYQPIWDIKKHRLKSFEALVRWRHPRRGVLAPDVFIGLAEETGLICELGREILSLVCNQLRSWRKSLGSVAEALEINVNLSAAQLSRNQFSELLDQTVDEHQLRPSDINIEITESLLLEDDTSHVRLFQHLRDKGYSLILDDFGTGFSSLSYLHRFPIDTLKVDRSFIQSMEQDASSKAIVETIFALSKILELQVVAEGVETDRQEQLLREMGCTMIQGYRYSRPLQRDEAAKFLMLCDSGGQESQIQREALVEFRNRSFR